MEEEQVNTQSLVKALAEIRKTAMDHPAFDQQCFDERDLKTLCDEGGDTADWTMIAIVADDALKEAESR